MTSLDMAAEGTLLILVLLCWYCTVHSHTQNLFCLFNVRLRTLFTALKVSVSTLFGQTNLKILQLLRYTSHIRDDKVFFFFFHLLWFSALSIIILLDLETVLLKSPLRIPSGLERCLQMLLFLLFGFSEARNAFCPVVQSHGDTRKKSS